MTITPEQLAGMIDQTELKPFITDEVMKKHCELSNEYGFKTVAINNAFIEKCIQYLGEDSKVIVDAAVSFPLGQCTLDTKCYETEDAILKGAKEVDYVININELKTGNLDYIEKEMASIVAICKKHNVISKVIFETCYLTEEEKITLCQIANKVKPDFIKTSTGFGTAGATLEDVKLMRKHADDRIKIKASGGIRTLEQALAFIEAGANRLGTSRGIELVEELKNM